LEKHHDGTQAVTAAKPASKPARLGAFQIGSHANGTAATLERIMQSEQAIRETDLDVLVFPEALLGGYPKGADFGARVGYRTEAGRDAFLAYWQQAIELDGAEVKALCELAQRTSTAFVVGAIERANTTLYCVSLLIDVNGQLVGRHRKLMPTASERLIWGQGDGSTLATMDTSVGRLGSAICWENYMPLFRSAMYAKGLDIWCAPTVDERDIWQASMRHIAYESRCFVISACQFQAPASQAMGSSITLRDRAEDVPMIRGGSCIVSPFGEVIAGPLYAQEGLVIAEVDMHDVVRARFDLDVSGHYARPDVFELRVNSSSHSSKA
jgi:nitrilase